MVRVHTLLFLTIAISCVMCTLPFNVCFPGNALCRVSAGTVRLAQRNVVDSLKDLFLLLLSFLMTVTAGSSCSFSCFWIARKATAELPSQSLCETPQLFLLTEPRTDAFSYSLTPNIRQFARYWTNGWMHLTSVNALQTANTLNFFICSSC